MSTTWLILTRRYGADVRNPTQEDLQTALAELCVEDLPGMSQADYEEHGAAFLRYGIDEGPMYVVTVSRTGIATFEQWQDQDYMAELEVSKSLQAITREHAGAIWSALAEGNIEQVRQMF